MRTFFFMIGFLLLPQSAMAAALSPWVQTALDKASLGIATAESFSAPTGCDLSAQANEAAQDMSLVRAKRLLAFDLGTESEFLRERTLCLESDRILLQNKINEIYDQLLSATTQCNFGKAIVLRTTFEFMIAAYKAFIEGSVDASFSGSLLRYTYPFESAELFHTTSEPFLLSDSEAPECVFTTDYAPHFVGKLPKAGEPITDTSDTKSYGCDSDVLTQIYDALPDALKTEADDLKKFQTDSNAVAADLYPRIGEALFNIDSTIAILRGDPAPAAFAGSALTLQHGKQSGCLRPLSPEPRNGDAANATLFDEVLSVFPDYFRLANFRAEVPTYDPTIDRLLPVGALFVPSYDFFGILPSAPILTRAFDEKRSRIGRGRPLPTGSEFEEGGSFAELTYKNEMNQWLREVATETEGFIGQSDAILKDSYERTLDTASPLQGALESLAAVTENFLPKQYIPSVTYFLRRSCVDGHCGKLLDAVAKRTFNPFCHPYLSGKYTDEKASDKCFCTEEFDDEDYCSGGDLHLEDQPPLQLQCGEPLPSSSSAGN